jgi:nitrogen-specific signal transduction histidine kinase
MRRSVIPHRLRIRARRISGPAEDDLVSVLSHELRTPLAVIVGYAELLSEPDAGPLTDRQRRFLEAITAAGQRLSVLADNLAPLLGSHDVVPSSHGNATILEPASASLSATWRTAARSWFLGASASRGGANWC